VYALCITSGSEITAIKGFAACKKGIDEALIRHTPFKAGTVPAFLRFKGNEYKGSSTL